MTVTEKSSRKVIVGAGWANPLTHDFEIESASQAHVFADGAELVQGVDYTVGGVLDPTGYSITITDFALWTPVTWVLDVRPLIDQGKDLTVGGTFGAKYEDGLDRLARRLQRVYDLASRSLKTALTTPIGTEPFTLPAPLANAFIGWNAAATALENKVMVLLGAAQVLNENDFASNSLTGVPNQSSAKAYVDFKTPGGVYYGAVGNGAVDDNAAVHAAAGAAGLGGTLYLPKGKRFKISNTDFAAGSTHFEGPGSIGTQETYGFWKRNSYADQPGTRNVYFPEYQSFVNRAILASVGSQASPTNTVVIQLRGDSQTAGGYGEYVKLEAAIHNYLDRLGLHNHVVANLGIPGTRWSQLLDGSASQLPASYVGIAATMLGFGANDLDYYDFPTMIAHADAALAWIRSKPGGGFGTHTIYLRIPNAMTYGPAVYGGVSRNEELSELFLQAYMHLGRKYHCVVWDAYGNFRDARNGVGYSFDNAFGDGRAIHPMNDTNEAIAAQFMAEAFPEGMFARVSTNGFENHGAVSSTMLASILPNQFKQGQKWYRATVANGFPFEGMVMVNTNVDGPSVQTLIGYANGTSEEAFRTANIGANSWNPWVYLTEANGTYTPVVTASSGTITTVGAVSGRYKNKQDLCYFSASAAITTNGAATGALRITTPFTAGTVLVNILGREASTSGASLIGEIAAAGTFATVLTYNNAYPAANGSLVRIAGHYWL